MATNMQYSSAEEEMPKIKNGVFDICNHETHLSNSLLSKVTLNEVT